MSELQPADAPWSGDDEYVAEVAARCKALREAHRLSLEDAARLAGFSKNYLWEFERGRAKNPMLRLLMGLARAYGTSLQVILGDAGRAVPIAPEAMRIASEVDALLRRGKS